MLEVEAAVRLGDFALDIAFRVPSAGVTLLFGPSGAGKSATLAVIAGGLKAERGRVVLNDRVLFDSAAGIHVPAERRRIGLMHQDARLFPHMPVRDNLLYGWKRARGERRTGLVPVVEVLGIGHLLNRRPTELSGGERQRVAIGRALLSQPDLLLLDEPMASLDRPRKAELLPYLEALHGELGLPILYVTHDLAEATRLGDRIVRIARGKVSDVFSLRDTTAAQTLASRLARAGPAAVLAQLIDEGIPDEVARLAITGGLSGLKPWDVD